jgi:hypothetical protein
MHLSDAKYLRIRRTIHMLLPKDILPENSIYFYGSLVLKYFSVNELKKTDIITLYHEMKKESDISMISFSLTLDWLFLINTVEIDSEGVVNLCT